MKTKNQIDLENYFPFLLRTISAHISRGTATTTIDGHKIGMREWRVIALLADEGISTSKQICFESGMDKASVSRALAYLKEQKLVSSNGAGEDWRSKPIKLTRNGEKIYQIMAAQKIERAESLWSDLTDNERKTLLKLLQKLRRNVHKSLADSIDENG